MKEGLPFAWDLSLESSKDYLCFWLALLHSVLLLFPLSIIFLSLCTVFDSISFNIDEVFSINPSANVFVFGHFDIHHEDCLTYSSGTDRPGELVIFVILSNDLTQMVNFSIWIPDSDFQCPALLDLFLSFGASICFAMSFPLFGNSEHVAVSISIDFPPNKKRDVPFHCIAYDYSSTDRGSLHYYLRDVP